MRRSRIDLLKPRILEWVMREPGVYTPNALTRHLGFRRSSARGALSELLGSKVLTLDPDGRLIPETPASQDPLAGRHVDRDET